MHLLDNLFYFVLFAPIKLFLIKFTAGYQLLVLCLRTSKRLEEPDVQCCAFSPVNTGMICTLNNSCKKWNKISFFSLRYHSGLKGLEQWTLDRKRSIKISSWSHYKKTWQITVWRCILWMGQMTKKVHRTERCLLWKSGTGLHFSCLTAHDIVEMVLRKSKSYILKLAVYFEQIINII